MSATKASAGLSIPPHTGFDSLVARHVSTDITGAQGYVVNLIRWQDGRVDLPKDLFKLTVNGIDIQREFSMKAFLKVKIKSLAAEARIIRQDEKRAAKRGQGTLCNELHSHRMNVVRPEQRATLYAYAIIRNRDPSVGDPVSLGNKTYCTMQMLKKVEAMVKKYGDADALRRFDALNKFALWVPKVMEEERAA